MERAADMRIAALGQWSRFRIGPWQMLFVLVPVAVCSLIFDGYQVQTPIIALSLSNILLGLSVLTVVLVLPRSGGLFAPPQTARLYLILGIWLMGAEVVSAVFAPERSLSTMRPAVTWAGFVLLTWVVALTGRQSEHARKRLRDAGLIGMGLLAVLTFAVLVGLLDVPVTGNFGTVRTVCGITLPGRELGTPLTFGFFGLLYATSAPLLMQTVRGIPLTSVHRLIAGALLAIMGAVALITAARSVWVTALSILVLFPFITVLVERRLRIGLLGVLVIGVIGVNLLIGCSPLPRLPDLPAILSLPSPASRISPTSPPAATAASPTPSQDEFVRIGPETIGLRLDTYATAVTLFRQNPVIGNGTVYAERVVADATGTEGPIHNKFLATLAGTGALGFVPFALLWVVGLVQCRALCEANDPARRALGVAYLVGLIAMSIQLQFFGGESLKPLAVLLGLIAADRDARLA